jgi:hypothetical protein
MGIFQRIPFVIRPGMDSSYLASTNMMKYNAGVDINRGYFQPGMHGMNVVPSRKKSFLKN